jgi:hypothetical protein
MSEIKKKVCCRCGEEKELKYYYHCKTGKISKKTGQPLYKYDSNCRKCDNQLRVERRKRKRIREKIKKSGN